MAFAALIRYQRPGALRRGLLCNPPSITISTSPQKNPPMCAQ
jgi:hypothetical protein